MSLLKSAGVSFTNGTPKFHASKKLGKKELFVAIPGETVFVFVKLPEPMTKADAAKHMLSLKEFEGPDYQLFLNKFVSKKTVAAAPKPVKVPKAPVKSVTPAKPVRTQAEKDAMREKLRQVHQQMVAKRA